MQNHELDQETQTKIIRVINALIPEADIYLFGSRATGQASAHSDIDIALDAGQRIDSLRVAKVRDMLAASNIVHAFDIVDMHAIGQELKKNIEDEGILWLKAS